MSDKFLCAEISPIIEKLNRESQSHARIPRNMLIPMPHAEHSLEKSSKGTVLRGKAEERYVENIAKAYDNVLPDGAPQQVLDEQVPIAIRKIILNVVGGRTTEQDQETLTDDTELFAYGIDSVGCIQIRHALSHLIPKGSGLPLTVVEDQGTISRLSNLILHMRSGQTINGIEHEQEQADQQQLMLDLAKEYSTFNNNLPPTATRASTTDGLITPESPSPASKSPHAGLRILLTGPTGSLGSHILHQLLSNPRVSHIYLLVRGASAHASRERVLKALSSRLLPISADSDFDAKTTIWQCKISDAHLGLSDQNYTHLRSNIDVIIHLAWSVNFLLPLRSFAATHLSGLRNLIDLALSSPQPTPSRVVFCSSVASVSQYPDLDLDLSQGSASASAVPERPMSSPASAGPTGYARSKWVAEAICVAAHRHTRLRNRISIARVGQLSGATDTGVWSKSEAYPLMLSSIKATGVLPALQGEVLNWLPVDLAARAFVEDALNAARPGGSRDVGRDASAETDPDLTHVDEQDEDEIPVHHVLNPNNNVQWSDLLSCLSRRETFKTVPVHEWLDALSVLQHDEKTKDHPSLKLLGFWKTAYSSKSRSRPRSQVHSQLSPEADGEVAKSTENSLGAQVEARAAKARIQYDMKHTYDRMPCLKAQVSQVMKEEYMLQLWDWIKENV
jgi:thioester reductase-like protein/aryl carrier-like protein